MRFEIAVENEDNTHSYRREYTCRTERILLLVAMDEFRFHCDFDSGLREKLHFIIRFHAGQSGGCNVWDYGGSCLLSGTPQDVEQAVSDAWEAVEDLDVFVTG